MGITDSQSDLSSITAELEIEKIISNGCGLARYDGRAVFIPYTVPGERVAADIDLTGKKYLEGRLVDIITRSPDRVQPVCPYFSVCGGCNLQHISNEKQLIIRKGLVEEALRRNGGVILDAPVIVSGNHLGYRNRVQFHPSEDGSPGFMERKSNRVVAVKNCAVCSPGINSFLLEVGLKISERTVVFSPDSNTVYSSSDYSGDIAVVINKREIKTSISSFFQSNISMFARAIEYMDNLAEGKILLDLYAGAAVFGSFLSEKFEEVISVEENRESLLFGEKNIEKRKGLELSFFPVSVEKYIKRKGNRKTPDTVIVDPPRTGLSRGVIKYLADTAPEKILYLSCDYATLGRDLGLFVRNGYVIDDFRIFDFYPQTTHAESLAVLRKTD